MDCKFVSGGIELLDHCAELWAKLNQLHQENSSVYKSEFASRKFASRQKDFYKKDTQGHLFVDLCLNRKNTKVMGYCISSILNNVAEIESIFLEPQLQGQGIGRKLIETAIQRLKQHHPKRMQLGVAAGNESAIGFYQKFGFHPRVTILTYLDDNC